MSVGVDVGLVVLEWQRVCLVRELIYYETVFLRDNQVMLFHISQHCPLRENIGLLLRHFPVAPQVLPEEDIEDNAQDWYKRKHKKPCYRLSRLAVVHQYGQHCQHSKYRI